MNVHGFTPIPSLLGGALLGLSASMLLLANGRVAGVSGIVAGLLRPIERGWRLAFVLGLVSGGLVVALVAPHAIGISSRPLWLLALAGVLVGFGARLGGGCTSGHGICGLSRLSKRSLVATLTFMATAALAVLIVSRVGGLP